MKLLHINSYYSISKFYKNLYDEQVKSNIDLCVFVPVSSKTNNQNRNLGDYTLKSLNYKVIDKILYFKRHNNIYKDLISKVNINEFDIIHAHSLFSNGFIAYKVKKAYDKPYIVAVRNTDLNIFFKRVLHLRGIGIKILLNSEKIIFISEVYKNHCIDKYIPSKYKDIIESKSVVIPNGLNEFWFENKKLPKKKIYIKGKDYIKLLYVGDITRNKNIKSTIKAIEILRSKGHLVKFTVIGRIREKSYAKILNKDYIKYYGYMTKENLIDHYRTSDIFIMPSKHETFGIVYLESISQCTPVIFSKNQGFDAKGNDGRLGLSVKYNDIPNIASSIIKIMDNYNHYSENCFNEIEDYRWDKINEKYIDVYNKNIEL